jgi:thiamine kinase-like enzyme
VDYKTDYSNLNLEILLKREQQALAYIHTTNLGLKKEIPWLPFADRNHIKSMINDRWRAAWEIAKNNEQFVEVFGSYIPIVEEVSKSIIDEIEIVLNDESSHTLIHNDLNPGNVLIHNNNDVFFIDWEEARYGSFYLDIPIRFSDLKQAESYREVLGSLGKEIPYAQFKKQFTIASRYLGIRYMS